jgi:hypothetical protein
MVSGGRGMVGTLAVAAVHIDGVFRWWCLLGGVSVMTKQGLGLRVVNTANRRILAARVAVIAVRSHGVVAISAYEKRRMKEKRAGYSRVLYVFFSSMFVRAANAGKKKPRGPSWQNKTN